jgi:hypothetical protein
VSGFGHGFRRSGQRREEDQHDFTQATLPGKQPVITSILRDFSAEALNELRQWLEVNPPAIPIYQLPGFTQFTRKPQIRSTWRRRRRRSSFVDLATVGPTLDRTPDGQYLILWGALISTTRPNAASHGDLGQRWRSSTSSTFSRPSEQARPRRYATSKTLNGGGNNTIRAKYASDSRADRHVPSALDRRVEVRERMTAPVDVRCSGKARSVNDAPAVARSAAKAWRRHRTGRTRRTTSTPAKPTMACSSRCGRRRNRWRSC